MCQRQHSELWGLKSVRNSLITPPIKKDRQADPRQTSLGTRQWSARRHAFGGQRIVALGNRAAVRPPASALMRLV